MTKKSIFLLTIIISIFSTTTFAEELDLKNVIKAYNANLDSPSSGVIESSLMYIAKMKFEYPEANYKSTISKINSILSKNPELTLHYKLYLTKLLLSKPEASIANSVLPDTVIPSEFFINISNKMLNTIEISHK